MNLSNFCFLLLKHEEEDDAPVRLMIAVGVPAFDRKLNNRNGTIRSARLLGVAATDVPVNDINKLTLPYKVCKNNCRRFLFEQIHILLYILFSSV